MHTTIDAITPIFSSESLNTLTRTMRRKRRDRKKPISFREIYESNGLIDAIWALKTCDNSMQVITYAIDCAEHVQCLYEVQYSFDLKPRELIKIVRNYILGKTSEESLKAVRDEARSSFDIASARASYANRYKTYDSEYITRLAAAKAAMSLFHATYANPYLEYAFFAATAAREAAGENEMQWQAQRFLELF